MAAVADELKILLRAETKSAVNALRKAQQETSKSEGSFKNLAIQMGKTVAGYAAMALSVRAVIGQIRESVELAQQQELAERKLEAALLATGRSAEISSQRIKDLASELQGVTTYGDEATLEAAALAQTLGNFNQRQLTQIIPRIQDMASALGMDLNSAARLVGQTIGGTTNTLTRYGVQIDNSLQGSERFDAVVGQLTSKFGGFSRELADTAAGSMQQLENAIGDLKEGFGQALLEGMQPFIEGLTDMVTRMNEVRAATAEYREAVAAGGNATDEQNLLIQRERAESLREQIAAIDKYGEEAARQTGLATASRDALVEQLAAANRLVDRYRTLVDLNRQAVRGQQLLAEQQNAASNIEEPVAEVEEEMRRLSALPTVPEMFFGEGAAETYATALSDYRDVVQTMEDEAKQAAKEAAEAWKRAANSMLTAFSQTYSSWMALEQNRSARTINNLERELEAMQEQNEQSLDYKEALGYSEEELQAIRDELDEQEAEKQREIDKEKAAAAKKQFERQKLLSIAEATQAGAVAFVSALKLGVPAGPIAAATIASMTAAQIGMISATKFPGFARGGDFMTSGPQLIMVGDNPGGRERVRIDPQPDNRPSAGHSIVVTGNNFYGTSGEDEFIEKLTRRQDQLKAQGVLT